MNLSWITEKTRFISDGLLIQQLDYPTIRILSNLNFISNEDLNEEIYFYESFYCIQFHIELFVENSLYKEFSTNNSMIISWKSITFLILTKLKKYFGILCSYSVGEFLNLETLLHIKETALYYSSNNIRISHEKKYNLNQSLQNEDFDSNYIFKLKDFNIYQNLLLININLRLENPILNAKLRQKFLWDKKVKIFILGAKYNLTYKYIQLGISTNLYF